MSADLKLVKAHVRSKEGFVSSGEHEKRIGRLVQPTALFLVYYNRLILTPGHGLNPNFDSYFGYSFYLDP